MKRTDLQMALVILLLVALFLPFSFLENFQQGFLFNKDYWAITSFLKFGLLATLGEMIGLRISTGVYNKEGFGVVPRAIVWGVLGIGIKMAFVIFAVGTPVLVEKYFHINNAIASMKSSDLFTANAEGLGMARIATAFFISTFMNLIFAPVFMTLHKITDMHIIANGGTLKGFFTPIKFYKIFPELNWSVQWNFVFKKTIPFFWIPAHTITFLMPPEYRIVFAALLGIILGVILTIAAQKSK
ncbi:MAG: hypothetical protein B6I18_04515 [Bacteroidetes bacterium 4572_112]|nr:MAG: hypothetical protein B6I18_04515 [Bacteroidetes bacterium 4572_112]